jgi:hypothetical protein
MQIILYQVLEKLKFKILSNNILKKHKNIKKIKSWYPKF